MAFRYVMVPAHLAGFKALFVSPLPQLCQGLLVNDIKVPTGSLARTGMACQLVLTSSRFALDDSTVTLVEIHRAL